MKKTWQDYGREWLDTLVVAISVAMAFRAYFYEPFKIPTGSTIEFGYCDAESDVYRYQGAEYDTIRFDELTHFTESQYLYLLSRLRGANSFPKQIKSSTNPGGVGHQWVKARFIDPAPPETEFKAGRRTRIFLPSRVQDNHFLMESDPEYLARLNELPENQKRALLYGEWDLFEGQFFPEFRRETHVSKPSCTSSTA